MPASGATGHPVRLDDIEAARQRGRGVVLETPTLPTHSFSRMIGSEVLLKAENLQRTGSFKIRGAMNAIGLLDPGQRAAGIVAASAGNHAQGVALAASEFDAECTVFMPENAAIPKIGATKAYGAEVVLVGSNLAEATDHAQKFIAETGGAFIHPFDDPAIVAGQGSLGLELIDQVDAFDTVVIPVGGGGLISGSAIALKAHMPHVRIVGVQTTAVPTYVRARATGRAEQVPYQPTVSDGIAVPRPSDLCFGIIEDLVDDLIAVDDDITTEAVALLLERAKYLVEPSGAVGLAAMLHGRIDNPGRTVVVLSGGNVDLLVLDGVVRYGLETRGRFVSLEVVVPDEPGNLAALLTTIGDLGANVLTVEHRREGAGLEFGTVEIHVSLETRGPDHIAAILEGLAGYEIRTQAGRGNGSP